MTRSATVWQWLLAVVPCAVTLVALTAPTTPVAAKLTIAAIFIVTLASPAEGLLLSAGMAPLGSFLASLFDLGPFRLTEAIIVAFIAGWLIRASTPDGDRPRLPGYATTAAWLLAALVAGSIVALGLLVRASGGLRWTLNGLASSYYVFIDHMGVVEGAKLLEGLVLVTATIQLFGRRPALATELPVALGASAVCAALTSALLWFGIGPDPVLAQHARIGYRFSAHVSDVNAAGSYFALVLCLSLGMSIRERGAWRAWWLVSSAACGFGLWLCASRSAEAAAAVVISTAVVWAATARWKTSARAFLLGVVLAAALVAGAVGARQIERDPTYTGAGLRSQFVAASLGMLEVHPLFGVGVGQYYFNSPLFLTPQLAYAYGSENAHNNFLQIAVETGVTGFVLFALWLMGTLHRGAGALARTPHDWRLLGAVSGVAALLGTCLVGHPLLVVDVAAAFWMQVGLVAALGSSSWLNRQTGRTAPSAVPDTRFALWPAAGVAGALLLVWAPSLALRAPLAPVGSEAVSGFYEWETGADGARFRWTREYASLFVPAGVRRVEIPVRAPMAGPLTQPVAIEVASAGATTVRAFVIDRWSTIAVDLPPVEPPLAFGRINIRTNSLSRPMLFTPGSADSRIVGIQVGEYRVVGTSN
jgi:O-antigen ligase